MPWINIQLTFLSETEKIYAYKDTRFTYINEIFNQLMKAMDIMYAGLLLRLLIL